MSLIAPLLNYAADRLGLDRQLFVPTFTTLEGVLTKNPAAILQGVTGLGSGLIARFSRLARIEDPSAAARAVGIDLPTLKHAAVSYVAKQFTKRFTHMGDVLKSRTSKHLNLSKAPHRMDRQLLKALEKHAKDGKVQAIKKRRGPGADGSGAR